MLLPFYIDFSGGIVIIKHDQPEDKERTKLIKEIKSNIKNKGWVSLDNQETGHTGIWKGKVLCKELLT